MIMGNDKGENSYSPRDVLGPSSVWLKIVPEHTVSQYVLLCNRQPQNLVI